MITLLRFGRIHKVRFSCLFTLSAIGCGIGAAKTGMVWASEAIISCRQELVEEVDHFAQIFACGFVGILGAMLAWAAVVVILGFVLMSISKMNDAPWFGERREDELDELDDMIAE